MSDLSVNVQDLVNGKGDWTNIQSVLRLAMVDVIRAISKVDEKCATELGSHSTDMHQVRNHLIRNDKANEKTFKSIYEHIKSVEGSLEGFAKASDIDQLKDQLLQFVHSKTKDLSTSSVVSAEQFADLRQVLEGLPSKDDFEQVIGHLKEVEAKNRKISKEISNTQQEIERLGELMKEKPDKTHYDTLTKRLLFLDRKVKAFSDKCDKYGRRTYDIEETLLQLPSKETIEELGDHIVGLVQSARMDLGEQITHATRKVDEFDAVINSKASKSDMTTEMYDLSKKVEDLTTSVTNKATKSDLDIFVRDLSVLETSSREWREKNFTMVKTLEGYGKELLSRVHSRDLQELEQRLSTVIDSKVEALSVSVDDEFTNMKQLHSDLNLSKADKQDTKKISKEVKGMNTRFRDWHDLIRQANTKASEIEGKLADFATKQEHQTLQKSLTSTAAKAKGLADDQDKIKKKIITIKEEVATLPVRNDLHELQEKFNAKIAAEAKVLETETTKVSDYVTKLVKEDLPNEYTSKGDLNVAKELMTREAQSMLLSTKESISSVEKKLALVHSETSDQIASRVTLETFDQMEKRFNSKLASTSQTFTDQVREGQLRADRIESQLESKSEKLDIDMFTRDLSSLEQVSQLFTQQASSRLESLDSKIVSLAESLNDQVEVSKKLHMDFLQKPDRDDIKLLILAELNTKTKGLELNSQSHLKKITELSTKLDNQLLVASEVQSSWQEDHDALRTEVRSICEGISSEHKNRVRELKDDTIKTMETVLEGLHKHQKEMNVQMLDFEQQMRHRFEDSSSSINQQHNHEVARRIENETAMAEGIQKLQLHVVQLDEAHSAFKETVNHSVEMGGGIQEKLDSFARQVNTRLVELSNTRGTLEQDVNSQVVALQKKFTDVSRDIIEAVDGKISRCITRNEMEHELESLRKLVSLKSKMALNSNHHAPHAHVRRSRVSFLEKDAQADSSSGALPLEVGKDQYQSKRILELESRVKELQEHKPPPTSILSHESEVGGLVRMWGDEYTSREKYLSRHLKQPAPSTNAPAAGDREGKIKKDSSSGDDNVIASLLDKSAQRILSIRTHGGAKKRTATLAHSPVSDKLQMGKGKDHTIVDIDIENSLSD